MSTDIREREVGMCKAFANSTRWHILALLEQGEWLTSKLRAKVGISKPNLSQQMAVLKGAGLVRTRREGRTIYCSLAFPEVKSACQRIHAVLRVQMRKGKRARC